MSANTNEPTRLETAFGGGPEFGVTLVDGTVEMVRIRQCPVAEYQDGVKRDGDDFALVEWYCNKPAGWAKKLIPPDFTHIVREGERINADFFGYLERAETKGLKRLARLKEVAPERYSEIVNQHLGTSSASSRMPRG